MNENLPSTYNGLLDVTSAFMPLQSYIEQTWAERGSELEFLAILKSKAGEFLQYQFSDLELLQEEIRVPLEQYDLFKIVLEKLILELKKFEPEWTYGQMKSNKNGFDHSFEYAYFFDYLVYLNSPGYVFRIWEKGREDQGFFSFQLRQMENGTDLKVVDLYPDSQKYYLGKGISIAIILESKSIFQKRIISSSNKNKSHSREFNTPEAIEKVWKRLKLCGKADYNSEFDYYFLR
jgi:hypothetical protein